MERVPAAALAISGAIGGSTANLLLYPLDVVTVRLQVLRDTDVVLKSKAKDTEDREPSIKEMFNKILEEEGWPALLEGVGDDLIATFSQSFLYFFVYDYLRNKQMRYLIRKNGHAPHTLGIQTEFLFGAIAGMFCKLFTTPIKNIVILKQIDHGKQKSVSDCVREIYQNKGITGLWSGYRATIFLSANPSLSYYFYQLLGPYRKKDSSVRVFFRAVIAKSLATFITYPLILGKTRTQARKDPSNLYENIWKTFKIHGVTGLYDGMTGQLLKGCISQGITMTTKESISKFVVYVYIRMLLRAPRFRA